MTRPPRPVPDRARLVAYAGLPALALLLALSAGWLRFCVSSARVMDDLRAESTRAASEFTTRILSYTPDTVDADTAETDRLLAGSFREQFDDTIRDQLVADAKARRVVSEAEVPMAAPIEVNATEAQVLVFVDRTVTVGSAEPAELDASYRVTLTHVDRHWLVTEFQAI